MRFIRFLIQIQEKRKYNFYVILVFSVFVGLVRALEEMLFFRTPLKNSQILTFIPFYLSLAYLLGGLLHFITKVSWRKTVNVVMIGLFLGLFPPFIDKWILGNDQAFYGYYYLWNLRDLPWTSYNPDFNFPLGEALTVWGSILFMGFYAWLKTTSVTRTLTALGAAYLAFLWQGSFLPMLVTHATAGDITSLVHGRMLPDVYLQKSLYNLSAAQAFSAYAFYLVLRAPLMKHLFSRFLHALPFILITILGAVFAGIGAEQSWLPAFFIGWAAMNSLAENNVFDKFEDALNAGIPPSKYRTAAWKMDLPLLHWTFALGLLFCFFQNQRFVIPVALAAALSMLYNYPWYRAKKVFPANIKIEGVWGGSAFLAGLLLAPIETLRDVHLLYTFLVFGGWSLVASLKDGKDLLGDAQARNKTIYIFFQRKGIAPERTHRVLHILISLAFFVPVVWALAENQPHGFLYGAVFALTAAGVGLLTRKIPDAQKFRYTLSLICVYLIEIYFYVWRS